MIFFVELNASMIMDFKWRSNETEKWFIQKHKKNDNKWLEIHFDQFFFYQEIYFQLDAKNKPVVVLKSLDHSTIFKLSEGIRCLWTSDNRCSNMVLGRGYWIEREGMFFFVF